MLQTFVSRSVTLSYKKILTPSNLGLYCSQMLVHDQERNAKIVNDLVNLNEKEIKKREIDPRVEKWGQELLYSDYIQRRSLKFGHKLNKIIINKMKRKIELLDNEKLINSPVFSVTLNDNDDDNDNNQQFIEEDKDITSEELDDDSKPIYMPYAAKDSFKRIEKKIIEPAEDNGEILLNTKFKVLYEKYLETMESTKQDDNLQSKNFYFFFI